MKGFIFRTLNCTEIQYPFDIDYGINRYCFVHVKDYGEIAQEPRVRRDQILAWPKGHLTLATTVNRHTSFAQRKRRREAEDLFLECRNKIERQDCYDV